MHTNAPSHPNFDARTLSAALRPYTEVIQRSSNSGQLLFARHGGRLLGLYPLADGPNALWVNPALTDTLATGDWMTGGERLWLAPERDFFYRNPANFDGVHVPATIDPGHYQIVSATTHSIATSANDDNPVEFNSQFKLHDFKQQRGYPDTRLLRRFQTIDDPYASGLDYIGVQIEESVTIPNAPAGRDFCAWSIAQVYIPHHSRPATTLIPTLPQAEILPYFDPIPTERAQSKTAYVRFRLDAAAIYKLAVRPEQLNHSNPVKALALAPQPEGTDWMCIVKRSQDVPKTQEQCVDIARNPATTAKGVVQSYNHGPQPNETSAAQHFGEIEIQLSPAKPKPDGSASSTGSHQLLAYSGSHEQILTLAQQLLQLAQPPALYMN